MEKFNGARPLAGTRYPYRREVRISKNCKLKQNNYAFFYIVIIIVATTNLIAVNLEKCKRPTTGLIDRGPERSTEACVRRKTQTDCNISMVI